MDFDGQCGNISSVRNMSKTLDASGNYTNNKTIGCYVEYLCRAFAFTGFADMISVEKIPHD